MPVKLFIWGFVVRGYGNIPEIAKLNGMEVEELEKMMKEAVHFKDIPFINGWPAPTSSELLEEMIPGEVTSV